MGVEEDNGWLSGGASTLGGQQRKKVLLEWEGVKDLFFFFLWRNQQHIFSLKGIIQ